MTSNEHLQHLVDLRDALLREVARLDVAICKESAHSQGGGSSFDGGHYRGGDLSWASALREAKIRRLNDSLAMHA